MPKQGYRYSLDPFLLADFVQFPPKTKRVVDMGTGEGIILFLLRTRNSAAHFLGLEKQGDLLRKAVERKKLVSCGLGISFVRADLRSCKRLFPVDFFDLVLSNPPYRKKGSGRVNPDPGKAMARHESELELGDWLEQSSYLLRNLGRLSLIFHPGRLVELFRGMEENGIQPERIRLVHGNPKADAKMALVEGVKNGKGSLKVERPLFVRDENEEYSDEMKEIYGKFEVEL